MEIKAFLWSGDECVGQLQDNYQDIHSIASLERVIDALKKIIEADPSGEITYTLAGKYETIKDGEVVVNKPTPITAKETLAILEDVDKKMLLEMKKYFKTDEKGQK